MGTEFRVVNNRVFLLGLDELYREAMKRHERGELLTCARRVVERLRLTPGDDPIEGYYAEDEQLREYFLHIRILQRTNRPPEAPLESLEELGRLEAIVSSPLYGRPLYGGKVLPCGLDPLSEALRSTPLGTWTPAVMTAAAHRIALQWDDISLTGLAARARDSLVLAALRESVVLYAYVFTKDFQAAQLEVEYVWEVEDDLAESAARFVDTFNILLEDDVPPPDPHNAAAYWAAYQSAKIVGRCARIANDDSTFPERHYHWAICRGSNDELVVQDFGSEKIWTTDRYRATLGREGRCPNLEELR